ncbi:MAG: hypothetical protein CFE39_03380 [Comamonadaceae bacterium PBBC2]|nr:MAG: hypothetical protein CFE39_03380 [Comamonadaceae bacterium PBBC2]
MNWFEKLTGFSETDYSETKSKLRVDGSQLQSLVNGKSYEIGTLELVQLKTLRDRVNQFGGVPGQLKLRLVRGDVRKIHQLPENAGALFQVASQFNLLEMVAPSITPEHGVGRYEGDPTQGPACAIAAGAATIYRNYFTEVEGVEGQTKERQLNGLTDIGNAVSEAIGCSSSDLWNMRNGYAICNKVALRNITAYLDSLSPVQMSSLGGKLRIGLHSDVEVTDADVPIRSKVSQAFCSALPVAYCQIPTKEWNSFASLVLQAAYEATMWAGVLNAKRGVSNVVFLTRLGGGAFGNDDSWIDLAIRNALQMAVHEDLDVRIVSYGVPSSSLIQMIEGFQ